MKSKPRWWCSVQGWSKKVSDPPRPGPARRGFVISSRLTHCFAFERNERDRYICASIWKQLRCGSRYKEVKTRLQSEKMQVTLFFSGGAKKFSKYEKEDRLIWSMIDMASSISRDEKNGTKLDEWMNELGFVVVIIYKQRRRRIFGGREVSIRGDDLVWMIRKVDMCWLSRSWLLLSYVTRQIVSIALLIKSFRFKFQSNGPLGYRRPNERKFRPLTPFWRSICP